MRHCGSRVFENGMRLSATRRYVDLLEAALKCRLCKKGRPFGPVRLNCLFLCLRRSRSGWPLSYLYNVPIISHR
jgi:hypothetical protein